MMTTNHSCLPVELRTAVYRRALAQGYLNACKSLGITVSATLDELQMTIALELEGFYVRRHGPDMGMEMACTMLGDMVERDLLTAPPRLTSLGVTIMDELFCSQLAVANRATLH